jgi:hypothetical protein
MDIIMMKAPKFLYEFRNKDFIQYFFAIVMAASSLVHAGESM